MVDRLLVERRTTMPLSQHQGHCVVKACLLIDRHDVDARHHDLVQLGVAQRHHRADHLLLFRLKHPLLAPLLHDQTDLGGRELRGTGWVNAKRLRDEPGQRDEHRNQGADDLGKEGYRPGDGECDAIGITEGKTLRDELTKDDRDDRDDRGHEEQRDRVGIVGKERDLTKWLRDDGHDADCGDGGRQCTEEGDGHLNDREEATWIAHQHLSTLGAAITSLRELIEPGAAHRDKGDLCINEESVDQDQHEDDQNICAKHRYASLMMRAGTPTAVQPSGISASTTVPAPVFAPIPIPAGATISVPTPVKASAPMIVLRFCTPS